MKTPQSARTLIGRALVAGAAALLASGAWAQKTTGAIHGTVTAEAGAVRGAQVIAINNDSGFTRETTTDAAGAFALPGMTPGGYELMVTAEGFQEQRVTFDVRLGQDVAVTIRMQPMTVVTEQIEVTGIASQQQLDTRSSELAMNITPQQMESLPQNNRNFLAFAGLAPGVRFTDNQDQAGQSFSSGAQDAKQVNVFIDGLSYKNDIIQGGAFMQDSSRGNPFPQNAVQEYKVLTQNYKAEYEKASAAVITAVTRSGGNAIHGDAFFLGQNKSMVSQDDFSKKRGEEKPDYKRQQYGLSIGGPFVKDKLHYFLSWEGQDQDRNASVFRGGSYDSAPANVRAYLDQFPVGTETSPFNSDLFFGKLSWQPASSQTLDLSYNYRDEAEVRGFGGQRVKQGAESFEIRTGAGVLRHQVVLGNSGVNEAAVTWQKLEWNPAAFDPNTVHQNYFGLLDVGGKDSSQDLQQDKWGLRDDYSYLFDWHGGHTLKAGVTANWLNYDLSKNLNGNPTFNYRSEEQWQYPFEAFYGFGDPRLKFDNTQYGLYVQDDWQVLPNLTLNVGIRWDYETNMLNNDFVTPPDVVAGLQNSCRTYDHPIGGQNTWCIRDVIPINSFISTGDNRTSYGGMYQPRVGFTWDVTSRGETIVFGGWGKYYDRVTLNDIFDEQHKYSWRTYHFCFTADGQPSGSCANAIQWDPSYLSAAALDQLIARGVAPGPEVWLLANDTRPPYSNQWTLGLRQKLGDWNTSLSYANSRSYNGLVWNPYLVPPGTTWGDRWGSLLSIPGYGLVIRTTDTRKAWYDGYFLTVDKPYTASSGWGFDFAYTYTDAFNEVNDGSGVIFMFDYLTPDDWYKFPATGWDKHRVVASGTVGLPWNFRASGVITLGSGVPYNICYGGQDPCIRFGEGRPEKYTFILPDMWAYRSVDLRLEWDAPKIADRVGITLIAEGFNIFDSSNYNGWENFSPAPPAVNPIFGQPNSEFNTRRFQVGARLTF